MVTVWRNREEIGNHGTRSVPVAEAAAVSGVKAATTTQAADRLHLYNLSDNIITSSYRTRDKCSVAQIHSASFYFVRHESATQPFKKTQNILLTNGTNADK